MRNRILCSAIATALLLVSGLVAPKAWAAPLSPNSWIRISAFTTHPLAGADVAILGTDGQLLFEQLNATNNRGIYPAKVTNMPRNFRVLVVWEANRQPTLADLHSLGLVVLSADVRNYNPITDVVYVNPVTTIVTGVLLRHPEFNLEQARARVRRFLGIPINASLGAALRESPQFHSAYFSESGFLKQADGHGGLLIYVESLLSQMLSNPGAVHPFPSAVLQSGAGGAVLQSAAGGVVLHSAAAGIGSFIARNLITGALSWAGGQGVGWVAQAAGLPQQGATAEQILQLQQNLDALQSSVDQLKQQMDLATQEILSALTQTQYNTVATQAVALASDVNVAEQNLDYYAQGCPALPADGMTVSTGDVPDDWCPTQRALVLSQLSDIQINGSYERLAGWLLDTQAVGFKGMIHLFSQAAGQSVHFFRPADSTRVQNMFDYWQGVETQAANLKVELYHLNCDQSCIQKNPGAKKQITDFLGNPDLGTTGTFQATQTAEQKLMFPPVPIDTVINTKDRTMWLTSYPSNTTTYPGCYGAPPAGSAWIYPITSYVPVHPPQVFLSPTVDQANALIYGWTGTSPNQWLIDQSKAVAPDSPVSAGFPNIVADYNKNSCGAYAAIWTRTQNGTYTIYGVTYQQYYIVNLGTAQMAPPTSQGATRYPNWEFVVRTLDPGEQYYWYP